MCRADQQAKSELAAFFILLSYHSLDLARRIQPDNLSMAKSKKNRKGLRPAHDPHAPRNTTSTSKPAVKPDIEAPKLTSTSSTTSSKISRGDSRSSDKSSKSEHSRIGEAAITTKSSEPRPSHSSSSSNSEKQEGGSKEGSKRQKKRKGEQENSSVSISPLQQSAVDQTKIDLEPPHPQTERRG